MAEITAHDYNSSIPELDHMFFERKNYLTVEAQQY